MLDGTVVDIPIGTADFHSKRAGMIADRINQGCLAHQLE
jgi:hypothetical protein